MDKGITLSIFKNKGRSCSNGGLSSRVEEVTLIDADLAGVFAPSATAPAVVLVAGPGDTIRVVPADLHAENKWVMFGGTFVFTSDSRVSRLIEKKFGRKDSSYALKLFDRVEG